VLRGRDRTEDGRGQRRDHQAQAEPGQDQIGVEARQRQAGDLVAGGQRVHRPARDQPVRDGGEREPDRGDRAGAQPGGQQPAEHRPDRQRHQEPGQQQRARRRRRG
jgi:hypothetical protein